MKQLEINNRRYLGSKYKLLDFIDQIIEENNITFRTFFDIFAGTAVVAHHYSEKGKTVFVNDLLLSNYYAYITWFDSQKIEKRKLKERIKYYNQLQVEEENYFSKQFGNTYFSEDDCKKIGYIREDIENLYDKNEINEREKAYLITALIYSMDRIANTVGHYDAYRKNAKVEKRFLLYELKVKTNPSKKNKIFHENANELVKRQKADVLFVDTPYNSRQYGDAYHLLENVAEWKKPKVYGEARKMDRNHLKSDYCMKRAVTAFSNLIEQAKCNYIIVTYNNMGEKGAGRSQAKISDIEMIEILEKKGKVTVYERDYNYFTTGKTELEGHKERVFLCVVGKGKTSVKKTSMERNKSLTIERLVKSPLNYVGGKYRLLPQILKEFPKDITHFIDCCCGGCNVGVNIEAKKITCIDSNKKIIDIYQLFQQYCYIDIIEKVEEIIQEYGLSNTLEHSYDYYGCNSSSGLGKYNKEAYTKLRKAYNEYQIEDERKVFLLLTLIFYSFNHQIRFNQAGEFNMPVGKRDFNGSIRKNLLAFCEKIQQKNITFLCEDFRNINVEKLEKDSFFYVDPPYLIADASYNEGNGWTDEDEEDLLRKLDELSAMGIKFALSNVIKHNGKKNIILIDWVKRQGYYMKRLDYNYNNSNYQSKSRQNKTTEVLITNYKRRNKKR